VTDDPRFRAGIDLFNKEEFFEAHEEWEALWHETRGEPRNFVQGMIQVTSAMHHLGNGNMRGARLLHDTGVQLLKPYGPAYQGVALADILRRFDDALREILTVPLDRLPGRGHPGDVTVPDPASRVFRINPPV
jgi:predicted metal-dependent hydrolase